MMESIDNVCGIQCLFSIFVTGFMWGATNPLMRLGSISALLFSIVFLISCGITSFFLDIVSLLKCWKFSVPFGLNQLGSVLFHALIARYPLSVIVPITNAVQLISAGAIGHLLGDNPLSSRSKIGCGITAAGIALMILSDFQ